jgi:hypothetical protein
MLDILWYVVAMPPLFVVAFALNEGFLWLFFRR